MNRQSNLPVITISRQYGAGGRTIARGLSARFDIPWYDKDFVAETAAKSGYSEEDIRQEGEQLSAGGRFLNSVLNTSAAYSSSHDGIFLAQKQVIMDLSAAPCIIVGRCADYILRDRDDCLNVFIHAPKDRRAERIVKLYGESDVAPLKRLDDKDARRRVNYRHFTGQEWGVAQNYHLALDSGMLGIEGCVDLIAAAFQREEE